MEILKLEGETLGQKRHHYNKLLKEVTSKYTSQEIKKVDYNEPDINNLFKIDIASKDRNLDYILDVLKCEDMLYVSRALRQSTWLITDTKYADIINPEYINSHLLPKMTLKAGNKLMLSIRLNLKDEKRVELFYEYYEDKTELGTAMKWLPNCSISYIENVMEKHYKLIPHKLIKRLVEKSVTILEIYAQKTEKYEMTELLPVTTFVINKDAEKFINIVKSKNTTRLSAKATKKIMKLRSDIIIDNFEKFARKIDTPTFVKFLKQEEIKDFLKKHLQNKKIMFWFTFENLKHFIYRMPSESRLDFVKCMFIEKSVDNSTQSNPNQLEPTICDYENTSHNNFMSRYANVRRRRNVRQSSNAHIYKWYNYIPFHAAFTELKKLIRMESNPSERNEIFTVLVNCTRRNAQNLHTVIQYYRNNHINEPLKFKSDFVNTVLSKSFSHRFDEATWTILNEIFCSIEVYSENKNNIQVCLEHIIIYKVTHDTKVPDIVEKKFEFDTLKSFQSKLNVEEKDKVFNYLYQFILNKIQNITINSESNFKAVITHMINILYLLRDWNKNLLNFTIILEKIREIIKVKRINLWNEDLSGIYNINKTWRKHMFQESLFLNPTQETCINALKHGPEILVQHKDIICVNDSIVLTRFFYKLRTYWLQTLGTTFEVTYRKQLEDITKHNTSIRGLCVLLSKQQLTDILTKYKPQNSKINWTETNDITVSIQKYFAKYLFLARPHPSADIVLLYAKGDYLQSVLPSLQSIFFNKSSDQIFKYIPQLLKAPVSLRKHGLKVAFAKLSMDEILPICLDTITSNKNSSIRATLFTLLFKLLCKKENETEMWAIWGVLETFIDNLTPNENRSIYVTLSHGHKVPLPIKPAYCQKSFKYLKSLPPKTNSEQFCVSVIRSTLNVMEFIDEDFAVEMIYYSIGKYPIANVLISSHLLSTKSEIVQTQRYERCFVPLVKDFIITKDTKIFRHNDVLNCLLNGVEEITLSKNMIMPIKLFKDIHENFEKNFSIEDNYVLITTSKLAAKFVQIMEKYRNKYTEISTEPQSRPKICIEGNVLYTDAASDFGKVCMEQLKEEVTKYFPSIHILFSEALDNLLCEFRFDNKNRLATLKSIQKHADIIEGHLLTLRLFPVHTYETDEIEERNNIYKILASHPSAEVRMHYLQTLRNHS